VESTLIVRVVFDIEADSLNPTVIWCLVCYDLDTRVFTKFIRPDLRPNKLREYAKNVDVWIGHNVIQYDVPAIEELIGRGIIPRDRVVDTLVLSWLEDFQRTGGHSLDNWGTLLGVPKYEFDDFSRFTLEMLDYCTQDVYLTAQVYLMLWSRLNRDEFKKAIALEHKTQWICLDMHKNGFAWDHDEARTIQKEIQTRLSEVDKEILQAFPVKSVPTEPCKVLVRKDGKVSRRGLIWYDGPIEDFCPDSTYSRLHLEVFNPSSPKQIIERLHEAGWRPVEKTKGHIDCEKLRPKQEKERALKKERLEHFKVYGWRVNETNLATLPEDAPEGARLIVERMLHASRLRTLEEWFEAYNPKTGRIHGTINAIGAWTQRKSHRNPNTANIAAEKSLKYSSDKLSGLAKEYGRRMRSLWRAGSGRVLVGTDAEGIQLRILAHYLKNHEYIDAICNGRKEDKTDIHSVNQRNIGPVCRTRDDSKTFSIMDVYKPIELRGQPTWPILI
jgi:DNA polymerase-1